MAPNPRHADRYGIRSCIASTKRQHRPYFTAPPAFAPGRPIAPGPEALALHALQQGVGHIRTSIAST
eukprot:9272732-Prorocentrum_lima.AAC.1